MKNLEQKNFEIIAVLITAVSKFLLIDWLHMRSVYILAISIFWIGYILLHRRSANGLEAFKLHNLKPAILVLLSVILFNSMACVLYASNNSTSNITWYILLVLLLYPLWGIIQQFIMLEVILINLVKAFNGKANTFLWVIIVSILFGIVHYPNFFLMIYTFCLELVLASVYLKWRNLMAIGITHGWVATFLLYFVLERNLWSELFLGF